MPSRNKKQSRKSRKKLESVPPPPVSNAFGTFLAFLGGLAALSQLVAIFLTQWIILDPVTYYYDESTTQVGPTEWGLYLLVYNSGAHTSTWASIKNSVCSQTALEAAGGELLGNLYDVGCTATCVSHFSSRCSGYTKMETWGTLTMVIMAVTAAAALIGAAWSAFAGFSPGILMFCWLFGGFLSLTCFGFWVWQTYLITNSLSAESQFPRSHMGFAAWIGLGGCSTLFLLGAMAAIMYFFKDWFSWRQRKSEITQALGGEELGLLTPGPAASGARPGGTAPFGAFNPTMGGAPSALTFLGGALPVPPPGAHYPPQTVDRPGPLGGRSPLGVAPNPLRGSNRALSPRQQGPFTGGNTPVFSPSGGAFQVPPPYRNVDGGWS